MFSSIMDLLILKNVAGRVRVFTSLLAQEPLRGGAAGVATRMISAANFFWRHFLACTRNLVKLVSLPASCWSA